MFPVSKFLLSRYFEIVSCYFEIAYLFPVSIFLLSRNYEITSLFPVSKFLLSHYFEIAHFFPVSKFSLSHYFEIAILLRDILSAEVSACDGAWYVRSGGRPPPCYVHNGRCLKEKSLFEEEK